MLATAFSFLDVPGLFTLADHELELVEPDLRYVEGLLASCQHPLTRELMPAQARTTRDGLTSFVRQNPRGQTAADVLKSIAPGYTFWMRIHTDRPVLMPHRPAPLVGFAGSISLRIGHSENLDYFLGHVGYHVLPPARGHHFAERATRMLLPLARAHGHQCLWITCNPDNLASRKTCERLGAAFVDVVEVPRGNSLYSQGDRAKCRYRLEL